MKKTQHNWLDGLQPEDFLNPDPDVRDWEYFSGSAQFGANHDPEDAPPRWEVEVTSHGGVVMTHTGAITNIFFGRDSVLLASAILADLAEIGISPSIETGANRFGIRSLTVWHWRWDNPPADEAEENRLVATSVVGTLTTLASHIGTAYVPPVLRAWLASVVVPDIIDVRPQKILDTPWCHIGDEK